MQKAIIGKKVGMTQIFDESGKVIPVTVVEAGPCTVTQKKTVETLLTIWRSEAEAGPEARFQTHGKDVGASLPYGYIVAFFS